MISLFGDEIPDQDPEPTRSRQDKAHPAEPGTGPVGEICGTCKHYNSIDYHNKTYRKCGLVVWTHGPGTDIRMRDAACSCWQSNVVN